MGRSAGHVEWVRRTEFYAHDCHEVYCVYVNRFRECAHKKMEVHLNYTVKSNTDEKIKEVNKEAYQCLLSLCYWIGLVSVQP